MCPNSSRIGRESDNKLKLRAKKLLFLQLLSPHRRIATTKLGNNKFQQNNQVPAAMDSLKTNSQPLSQRNKLIFPGYRSNNLLLKSDSKNYLTKNPSAWILGMVAQTVFCHSVTIHNSLWNEVVISRQKHLPVKIITGLARMSQGKRLTPTAPQGEKEHSSRIIAQVTFNRIKCLV